ncbi:MAG TPA: DUF3043 domain-containing protein [Jatrophihabitans sp.]
MKLLPRRKVNDAATNSVSDADTAGGAGEALRGKGRATPKRREAVPTRGPVTAPKNRKEAYARQKQLNREARATGRAGAASPSAANAAAMTPAERRAATRSGAMLGPRDQGPTKKLARDWVDSRRLFSNYLLLVMVLMLVSWFFRNLAILQFIAFALFLGCVGEWILLGFRIRKVAVKRGIAEGTALGIGFYAGSRAYLPRRWRMPAPQAEIGDEI